MNERQRRSDLSTANAVARGVNILRVRDRGIAEHYMAYKHVPASVIVRVLAYPESRRQISAEQSITEALAPSPPPDVN